MRKDLIVYCKYLRMQLLAGLEYKGWWLMCIQVLFVCITDPLPTLLMFYRMGSIGIWTAERILLIYALAISSFGIAESFCRGFDCFPWRMLQSGDFDRLLLRPRSIVMQVAGSVFHLHRLSRAAAGIFVVIWMLQRQHVVLTPAHAVIIIFAVIGGALTYCGVFIFSSGLAFFTIKALDWIYILTNASYQVTRVPIEHMPRTLYRMFTFFLPILIISYYPAAVVCGWGEPAWTGYLALPAGFAFLGVSLSIWEIGKRHYQSTGS